MYIILLGPPGGGKGTQALELINYYKIKHVSTGNIIREAIHANQTEGKQFQTYTQAGRLVPNTMMIRLIKNYLSEHNCWEKGFLLDGFPRTLEQAQHLDTMFQEKHITLNHIIHIEVTDAELITRLLNRRKKEHRTDDTYEVIKQRIDIYHEHIQSLLEFYKPTKKLIQINGLGAVDNITKLIFSHLE